MDKSKNNMIILLMLFCCTRLVAQDSLFKISGALVDKDSVALLWASVFLTDAEQHIISSSACDENGKFLLTVKGDNYIFGASSVGYDMFAKPVNIIGDTDLGTIALQESVTELQTVVVNGRIMRVRPQKDGFSVDVTGINQNYNDALDLLHSIPQLTVKGNDVSVVGKKNIIVQIGKVLQRVDATELASILKGYDAKLIERVEVLKQPPLRYDRDGNTAMVILHTSSAFEKYFGGLVGTELMKGTHYNYRYGGYGTVMYNTDRLFFSVSPSYNENGSYQRENTDYYYGSSLYNMLTPSKGDSKYKGVRATLQWNYSKTGMAGFTGGINQRNVDNGFMSFERYLPQTVHTPDADNTNNISFETPKKSVTAYMEQTFGKRSNKAWLEASYYDYSETQLTDYVSVRVDNAKKFMTYQDNDLLKVKGVGVNNDYSVKLDDDGEYMLDFGLKYMLSKTRKNRSHDQWLDAVENETYRQANNFKLNEFCLAPYTSATLQLNKMWWGRIGLIVDVTSRRNSTDEGWQPYKSFVTWLPSLHTTFTPSRNHQLSFTLNSSVQQPRYGQLNPFTWRISQMSYSMGNTTLRPEKHYNSRIGYTYKGCLSIASTLNFGSDIISSVTTINKVGEIISRPENAQNSMFFGLEASYWYDRLSWLTVSLNAKYGYSKYTSDNTLLMPKMTGWEWSTDGYLEFVFNKKRTLTGYISGSYEGKRNTTVSTINPQYDLGAGVTCFLLNRKLSVSLAGMSLFSSSYKGHSERNGYTISFSNRYSYPTAYLSVSYKFFNSNDKSVRRRISANEAERRF